MPHLFSGISAFDFLGIPSDKYKERYILTSADFPIVAESVEEIGSPCRNTESK